MQMELLTREEARVLGALIEKSHATPDYYPLTLNSLRLACNQKSARDPVTDYDEETLSLALAGLKRKTYAVFTPFGNKPNYFKYRHFLYDVRFGLSPAHLAVITVLLLRGSQTLNEVKVRAASLHAFSGLEEVETILEGLAHRPEPVVEKLAKRPGWKEPRWRHRFFSYTAEEDAREGEEPTPGAQASTGPSAEDNAAGRSKWEEFEDLKREVAALRKELAAMQETVDKLKPLVD